MVLQINDPYSGNIFGRLGAGIGKGISEELPKAVQRGATASTFERLGNEPNASPFQKVSDLVSQGQMPVNEAIQLLPFIQNAQKIEALKKRTGGTANKLEHEPPTKEFPISQISPQSSKNRILQSKEKLSREPTFQEIESKAAEFINSGAAFTEEEAKAKARDYFKETKASQKTNLTDFKNNLNETAARVLQGSGLNDYKDIEGRIIQNQVDLGEADILNDQNPAVVEKERRDILEKLGRAATQIKKIANKSLFTTPSSEKRKEWLRQKKLFEDLGYKNEFVDLIAATQNITPMASAHVVDPIKNEKLERKLNELDSVWTKLKTRNPFKEVNKINDKYKSEISSLIKPEDNLLDIGYRFRRSGLDVHDLFDFIRQKEIEKPFLSDNQLYQLDQPIKNDFFGDLLFEAR